VRLRTGRTAGTDLLRSAVPPLSHGDFVFLEVSDDGEGMSAETQARAFEPFYSTRFTGRGLGLSAVQGIVRAHQGGLVLQSVLGQGSSLLVLLPIANAPGTVAPTSSLGPAQRRALVIDSESSARELLRFVLAQSGFEVITSVSLSDGLRLLQVNQPIAVVLLGVEGDRSIVGDFIARARRQDEALPVLLITSEEYPLDPSGPDLTRFAYLRKPVSPAELTIAVQRLIMSPVEGRSIG
jgi:CheY-like chemotaxis protein